MALPPASSVASALMSLVLGFYSCYGLLLASRAARGAPDWAPPDIAPHAAGQLFSFGADALPTLVLVVGIGRTTGRAGRLMLATGCAVLALAYLCLEINGLYPRIPRKAAAADPARTIIHWTVISLASLSAALWALDRRADAAAPPPAGLASNGVRIAAIVAGLGAGAHLLGPAALLASASASADAGAEPFVPAVAVRALTRTVFARGGFLAVLCAALFAARATPARSGALPAVGVALVLTGALRAFDGLGGVAAVHGGPLWPSRLAVRTAGVGAVLACGGALLLLAAMQGGAGDAGGVAKRRPKAE
jgi:hypothetical protein